MGMLLRMSFTVLMEKALTANFKKSGHLRNKEKFITELKEFGYDDVSLVSIVGEVGDIRRFPNHKKFVAYCGLNVSEKQSGKSQSKNCYITKRGNRLLRHTFYLMVLAYLKYKKDGHHAQFFNTLRNNGKHPKQ